MELAVAIFVDELAPIGTRKDDGAARNHDGAARKDDEAMETPKSNESRLKPALVCPPAPRKQRAAKRRFAEAGPPQGFFPAPKELDSVFLSLPSKKVRVGSSELSFHGC